MAKILHVEKNAYDRCALSFCLAKRFDRPEIEYAKDGTEAIKSIRESRPYILIIDSNITGTPCLEVVKAAKKAYSDIRIILTLPKFPHAADILEASEAGVSVFVTKGLFTVDEFSTAVNCVLKGETFLDRSCQSEMMRSSLSSKLGKLSPRQLKILILRGQGNIVKTCASMLHVSESTVLQESAKICKKFGVPSKPFSNAVRFAAERGIISWEELGGDKIV